MSKALDIADYGQFQPVRKNILFNGGFSIWQRGTSFPTQPTPSEYTSDRWRVRRSANTNNIAVGRSTLGLTGNRYSLFIDRTTGDTQVDAFIMGYQVEGQDIIPFQGETLTLSGKIWLGANYSGGDLNINCYTGTVEDQASSLFTGYATDNVKVANNITLVDNSVKSAWRDFTVTFDVLPTNIKTLMFSVVWTPTGTAGADDTVRFAQMQLEHGSEVTDFEYRSVADELALCQRYYWKGGFENGDAGYYSAASITLLYGAGISLPTQMRSAPTTAILTSPTYESCSLGSIIVDVNSIVLRVTKDGSAGRFRAYDGVYEADAEL